jgi:branched-chain amino acid transport system substrate-binding protein
MIQKQVQALLLNLAQATSQSLLSDCTTQGYTGWSTGIGGTPAADAALPKGTKGIGDSVGFPYWSDAAPVKLYRSVMTKYAPRGFDYQNADATDAWASLELFATALAHAGGSPSPSQVLNAYWNVKNQTLGGLLAQPVTFTKGKAAPQLNCLWLSVFENGKLVAVHRGPSGNGQQGVLRSSCISPAQMAAG